MTRLKNDSGFALILTLVITALMVAVVVEMIHQVYVGTAHSRGFRDGLQASMLAESGVEGVAKKIMPMILLASQTQLTTSLSDLWAKPIKLDDETGSLTIMITEESAKININDLVINGNYDPFTKPALQRLGMFLVPQLPESIWPSVANWISPVGGMTDSSGAAPSYYGALNPPYKPRNAQLLTLTELTLIKGFTPDMPRILRPFLTTFSDASALPPSRVNINTAPKEVLEALIDPSTADKIMAQRSIKAIADFGGALSGHQDLVGKIGFKGNVFRITSVATVKDSTRTVEAVVRLGTPELSNTIPTGFLSWQEY